MCEFRRAKVWAFKVASCEVSVKVTSERILFLILPRATGFVVPKSRSCKNKAKRNFSSACLSLKSPLYRT